MRKRYQSVSEVVKDLTDKKFSLDLDKEIADHSIAKALFALRNARGVTQAKIADQIGCTQGRISKLESSSNGDMKVSDLIAYADALGLQFNINFHRNLKAVDWVKYHAFQIREHLDRLAKLAHKDEKINDGVTGFFLEATVNLLNIIKKSAALLPDGQPRKRRLVSVDSILDSDRFEEECTVG